MRKTLYYISIFFISIVSRMASTIYYPEDIDSLRFALSIIEFDITKLQPHFPGYVVFCALGKVAYFITNSIGLSFAIIGGLSIFVIIWAIHKIIEVKELSKTSLFCSSIILLNPFIWLMSNRYMPDLLGAACCLVCFYFLTKLNHKRLFISIGYGLIGITAGIKLSFLPILLVPFINGLIDKEKIISKLASFIVGCLIWIIPMIYLTGLSNIIEFGSKHFAGHFLEYGGTILVEFNLFDRILMIIKALWADGLGGYWLNRNFITYITSISLLVFIICGHRVFFKSNNDLNKKLISLVIPYIIWIFLFQNVLYKARHILPILCIILVYLVLIFKENKKSSKTILISSIIYLISISMVTSKLINQHIDGTAIYKAKNYLIENLKEKTIVSIPLINYYLRANNLDEKYIDIDLSNDKNNYNGLEKLDEFYLIGNFPNYFKNWETKVETSFYHNPYVNNMWPEIQIHKLNKKKISE